MRRNAWIGILAVASTFGAAGAYAQPQPTCPVNEDTAVSRLASDVNAISSSLRVDAVSDPAGRRYAKLVDKNKDGVLSTQELDSAVRMKDPALMRGFEKTFGADAVAGLKSGADLEKLLRAGAQGPGGVADTGPSIRYDKLFEGPRSTWVVAFGHDEHSNVSPDIGQYMGFKEVLKSMGFKPNVKRTAVDSEISELQLKPAFRELVEGLKFKPAQQAKAKEILAGIEELGAKAVDPADPRDSAQAEKVNAAFAAEVGALKSSLDQLAAGLDNPRMKTAAQKLSADLQQVSDRHNEGLASGQDQRGYTVFSKFVKAPDGHDHQLTVKLFNSSQFKSAAEEYTKAGPEERGKFSLSHAGGGNGLKIGDAAIHPETLLDSPAPYLLMAPIACRSFEHYGPEVEKFMTEKKIAKDKVAFFGTSKEVELTQQFGAISILKDVFRSSLERKGGTTMLRSADAAYSPIMGTYDTDHSIKSDGLIHKKMPVLEALIDGQTMKLPEAPAE